MPYSDTHTAYDFLGRGGIAELLDPSFRTLGFNDEDAVRTVNILLRLGWTAVPPENLEDQDYQGIRPKSDAVTKFFQETSRLSHEEMDALPKNPDVEDVFSPWRKQLYGFWPHVLYDVSLFMKGLSGQPVKYNPPDHEIYVVDFPLASSEGGGGGGEDGQKTAPIKNVWETDILLIPAYVAPGVTIKFSHTPAAEGSGEHEGTELGSFSDKNSNELFFIRAGIVVDIHVEGQVDRAKGPAAVFLYGPLSRVTVTDVEEEVGEDSVAEGDQAAVEEVQEPVVQKQETAAGSLPA